MESWISILGISPFLGIVCSLLLRKSLDFQVVGFSLSSLFQFGLCVYLVSSGFSGELAFGAWPLDVGIGFRWSLASGLIVLVSALVFFVGGLFFYLESRKEASSNNFYGYALMSSMQLGLNGALLTTDIFNLFVFFEVLLISALVLIVFGRTAEQRRSAVSYLVMNFFASGVLLIAIGLIYQFTGSLSFEGMRNGLAGAEKYSVAALLIAAFGTKSALFPFYFWLPKTYPKLSGALGGIFGGLLTKVGLYAFLRVFDVLFRGDVVVYYALLTISVLSMLLGVFSAFSQKELRSILSFHIISQVGYISGGIALAGLAPTPELRELALAATIFYFIHHILVKSNLFFVASWMQSISGSTLLKDVSGLAKSYPLLSICFAISALSLAGIPPLSGFWAKLAVLQAGVWLELWVYVVAGLLAGLFTFLSMLKIWSQCFLGAAKKASHEPVKSELWLWRVGSGCLAISTLVLSFQPGWLFVFCQEAARRFGVGF